MYYARIIPLDIANGKGIRVSLFVSGCRNFCEDCFNKEAWDFNYGTPYTKETTATILRYLEAPHIAGLSLLGGEPFEPENQEEIYNLLSEVKMRCPDKNVWCWTGYLFEDIRTPGHRVNTQYSEDILSMIDVLVDGKFDKNLKNLKLKFRGSSNQRIIDVQKSIMNNELVSLSDKIDNE